MVSPPDKYEEEKTIRCASKDIGNYIQKHYKIMRNHSSQVSRTKPSRMIADEEAESTKQPNEDLAEPIPDRVSKEDSDSKGRDSSRT